MEIPVAITIENKTLNAKLSISDTDYGLICLTYQISAFVYAIASVSYTHLYGITALSFQSSINPFWYLAANGRYCSTSSA